MKKLLLIFLGLVALAFAVAVAGIVLAGVGGSFGGGATVLTLHLDQPLADYSPAVRLPFVETLSSTSVASLFRALDGATFDSGVAGLALYVERAGFGLGKAQELLGLFERLRDEGKFVECYLDTAGEGTNGTLEYYLTTACDRVSLAPTGELNLLGLYSAAAFYRGTLEKLHIEPQFEHAGDYKSAGEVYTHYEHSPAAEEALGTVLDDLFDQIVSAIAEARGLTEETVRQLVDRAPLSAETALAEGLVDALAYPDEFESALGESEGDGPARRFLAVDDYNPGPRLGAEAKIAVVFAQGTIVRGGGGVEPWSRQRYLGSRDLTETLRAVARDESIDAAILRIDSPGGSAMASDLMLREIERLAEAKPVYVSMSDVAASGGYYIAAKGARIVTQPATITGSIGVVGGKLVTAGFQEELLGISHDALSRGENADIYSTLTPFSPAQAEKFRAQMARVYDTFLGHVAAGREMSRDEAAQVAGGRIWTGRQAVDLRLADALGGLAESLALVRERLELDADAEVELDYYPKPPDLFDLLDSEPSSLLSPGPPDLASLLRPRAPQLLEFPPELQRLSRPF